MSVNKIHEEGFSKDADKLVRRLSLVALLLSRQGQPVGAGEIRETVEGYPLMTDEAFKKRFYEDRAELGALGVEIDAEKDAERPGEVYSLPASSYYLPPIELTHDELTALATCLSVLEDRFAYSQPLRLALLSLAQGRPELMSEAATPALAVLPEEDEAEALAVLPKLQAAIADRKTVRFKYYAIGRDETMERTVDAYGLQLVAGEWYLLGWCHLREAIRTFRLSRIRSRVTYASRAPHDFPAPDDFDIGAYRDRPPWQLGGSRATARIRVAPSMAWWVEAHYAPCGAIEREDDDGTIVFATPYAGTRPLVAWVMSLAGAAEVAAPQALRDEVALHL
jgi:proteasome accessory factor C